jgi:hypothetical protein
VPGILCLVVLVSAADYGSILDLSACLSAAELLHMAIIARFELHDGEWFAMSELYRYARVLVALMAEMRD